mmetsp:Transcript_4425/g.15842  ORF Transcript_4425/g.15842 Transcript_4425/m.15842 type:complete len:719 (+) Transcript_4425:152-2308(+)|eukprot:scaffold2088_cov399-Prasinococcus_capsulatus_cf.AAC.7
MALPKWGGAGSTTRSSSVAPAAAGGLADDKVVREIPVLFSPTLSDREKLYLFQYPLRPAWRPYSADATVEELRLKPNQSKVEYQYVQSSESLKRNHSHTVAEEQLGHLRTETSAGHDPSARHILKSSCASLKCNYAVLAFRGAEAHVVPLHAAVQLRPSMTHLDSARVEASSAPADMKGTHHAESARGKQADKSTGLEADPAEPELLPLQVQVRRRETERQTEARLQSHAYLRKLDEEETWVKLVANIDNKSSTAAYERFFKDSSIERLRNGELTEMPFNMTPSAYLAGLTPGRASGAKAEDIERAGDVPKSGAVLGSQMLSRRYLDEKPLPERLRIILSQGKVQILKYSGIRNLSPRGVADEQLLSSLSQMAHLVQGCWIGNSDIWFSIVEGSDDEFLLRSGARVLSTSKNRDFLENYRELCVALRDYVLFLFSQQRILGREQLEGLGTPPDGWRSILAGLAVPAPSHGGWDFKEATDHLFLSQFPSVAEDARLRWQARGAQLRAQALSIIGSSGQLGLFKVPLRRPRGARLPAGWASPMDCSVKHEQGDPSQAAAPEAGLLIPKQEARESHSVQRDVVQTCLEDVKVQLEFHGVLHREVVDKLISGSLGSEDRGNIDTVRKGLLEETGPDGSLLVGTIDESYFLWTLGEPDIDPLRTLVLRMLARRQGLRKGEIIEEAAKHSDIPTVSKAVYGRVMRGICVPLAGIWVLKSGKPDT